MSMVDIYLFMLDDIIRITLKVPLIRIILSIGSLNGKECLSEGHPSLLSYLLFVNLKLNLKKSNRKAMNRNWSNQKANRALKTKAGNK